MVNQRRPRLSDRTMQQLEAIAPTADEAIRQLLEESPRAQRALEEQALDREREQVLDRWASEVVSRMSRLTRDDLQLLASDAWLTDDSHSPTQEGRRGRGLVADHGIDAPIFGNADERRDLERDLGLSAGDLTVSTEDVREAAAVELEARRREQQQSDQAAEQRPAGILGAFRSAGETVLDATIGPPK